jgi:hypothetical protein
VEKRTSLGLNNHNRNIENGVHTCTWFDKHETFGYASLFFKFGLFEVDWLVSSKVQGKLNGRQLM